MSSLYKFLSPERSTYFENELLRYSPPGDLNDPYECLPILPSHVGKELLERVKSEFSILSTHKSEATKSERRWLEDKYKKAMQRDISIPKTIEEVRNLYYELIIGQMNEKIGILSLSRRWDISLMWSHYTASHSGFCIGFDDSHDFFQFGEIVNGEKVAVSPVKYSPKRSTVPAHELTTKQVKKILLTKAEEWSYEKEERSLRLLKSADQKVDGSPFNISLFRVPHSSVTEVVIGIKASDSLKEQATKFGKKYKVCVYKAEISESNFNFSRNVIFKPS
tara:strand:+ start:6792 stop:7625 length:834 start_codon:yes stop_codon:yes gene_type:complete